jgi:hypothetical protein
MVSGAAVSDWFDWWTNPSTPSEKRNCMAQAMYVFRDRVYYLNILEEELIPSQLAECVSSPELKGCRAWWQDDHTYPQIAPSPSSRILNVRYYVEQGNSGIWDVVPWAMGQRFTGNRNSWSALLNAGSYTGRPTYSWAAKHGKIPQGTKVAIRPAQRNV